MDNLDALLNDLHQTNVEILKRNQTSSPFQDYVNTREQSSPKLLETEIDAVPSAPSTASHSANAPTSFSSDLPAGQGKNLRDLDEMLYSLDHPEYSSEFSESLLYSPVRSEVSQNVQSPSSSERTVSQSMATESVDYGEEAGPSPETKLAAEHAAKQLDDLLISLGEIKLKQQNSSSKSATPTAPKNGDVFQLHSSQIDSVSTTRHTNGGDSGGRLRREYARHEVAPTTPQTSDLGQNGKSNEVNEPRHALSTMLNNLSSELAQKGAITSPKGVCCACNKPIVGMLISAMERDWHPDHFTCAGCGTCLVRSDFYERDNQPYCMQCHANLFSPKCAYCGEAILDKCVIALGRAWHPGHFFCSACHQSFTGNSTVHEQANKAYCSNCYLNHFGTRCAGCQQPIADSYITALDLPWHRNCFVCQDCGKQLTGSSFHEVDGYPYCEAHFYKRRGLLCASCAQPITGRCVNALGRRYHPEHFVCSYCLNPLQTGTFKEHANKSYCHQCFNQLFG
ncbi:unnamed protein product [Calicophoron daubneyi]|uniref:LIM zinc-binding domain-containing protein n=1 Tax=Calicophoron daubneyi TaxID=300641 RepID=A0AAV2TYA5_CALDB